MSGPYSSDGIPIESGQRFSVRIVQESGTVQTFPRVQVGVAQLEPRGTGSLVVPDGGPSGPLEPFDWVLDTSYVANGFKDGRLVAKYVDGVPWFIGNNGVARWEGSGWVGHVETMGSPAAGAGWKEGGDWTYNCDTRLGTGTRYHTRTLADAVTPDPIRAAVPTLATVRYAVVGDYHHFFNTNGTFHRAPVEGNWPASDGGFLEDLEQITDSTVGSIATGIGPTAGRVMYDLANQNAGAYLNATADIHTFAYFDYAQNRLDSIGQYPWMTGSGGSNAGVFAVNNGILYTANLNSDGDLAAGEVWWWDIAAGTSGQIAKVPGSSQVNGLHVFDGTLWALVGSSLYYGVT